MLKPFTTGFETLSIGLPITLGALGFLAYKIGPEMTAPLMLAMFGAIAVTNLCAAFSQRPLTYYTRFFEVSLLAGFIDSFVPQLGAWGLTDTPVTRLTLVVMVCMGAAVLQPVFYAFRLQRMTRFIPAPVFAGFLNATALILLLNQGRHILALLAGPFAAAWPPLVVAAVCFSVAYATRSLNRKLPAGVIGLVAASAAGFVFTRLGHPSPPILPSDTQWVLPITLLDWSVLDPSRGATGNLLLHAGVTSILLAVVVFLSTITAVETVSQADDKPLPDRFQLLLLSAGKIIGASLGSMPVSGTSSAAMVALRSGGLTSGSLIVFSALALLFYGLGVLAWVPAAAVIGLLLFLVRDIANVPSVVLGWHFLFQPAARRAMSVMQREDLLIIALVTLFGAMVNMVAALLAGMVLGLVLFVRRNGKSPIKDVHDGRVWRSNCARSTSDTALLMQQGERILCVRLQGALYFGVARSLRGAMEALLPHRAERQWLVLDWSAVVSHDTTLVLMLERFEKAMALRGVRVLHCARAGDSRAHADMDRALEVCETELLDEQRPRADAQHSKVSSLHALVGDLHPSAQALVLDCFVRRHYACGEHVLTMGEATRDLHVVVSGRADVLIGGGTIRLAGVDSGAILGEMGFLDGTPRAADVVAVEPLVSLTMSRERFEALSQQHPEVAQQILQSLCTELAKRLRLLHHLISRERA